MATDAVDGTDKVSKPRSTTVDLPFVHAEFRAPDLHLPRVPTPRVAMPNLPNLPNRAEFTSALGVVRSFLPPPRQLAYFGALGVLAAVELIEWPVAVAIGVGTAIAGRAGQRGGGASTEPVKALEQAKPPATPAETAKPVAQAGPPTQRRPVGTGSRATPAGQPVPAGAPRPVPPRRNKPAQGSSPSADGT